MVHLWEEVELPDLQTDFGGDEGGEIEGTSRAG